MTETLFGSLIGAASAIVGGFFSGSYQYYRNQRDQPVLILDFDSEADTKQAAWENFDGVVLRASLKNDGQVSALNCRVFVTDMTEVHGSGTTKTKFQESRQLPWAGWNFDPRAVPREVTFYVDVVRFNRKQPDWEFLFGYVAGQDKDFKNFSGTYRFKLVAVADNCSPQYLNIDVDYRRDVDNLRAWKTTL